MKDTKIQIRCKGSPEQYWTLKLFLNNVVIGIHTSKSYSYIKEIERGFLNRQEKIRVY